MAEQRTANVQMSQTVEAVCSDKLCFGLASFRRDSGGKLSFASIFRILAV